MLLMRNGAVIIDWVVFFKKEPLAPQSGSLANRNLVADD